MPTIVKKMLQQRRAMPKDSLLPPVLVAEISPAAVDAVTKALSPVIAEALAQAANKRDRVPPIALSAEEAAKFIGIGRSLFFEIKREDRTFPTPARVGQRTLYPLAELRAWFESKRGRKSD
jgi:predicted DNA-binding transcriptional regulator AlpA